uniref:Uncharacterized protein n=1 Tax=Ananas comosus var. bracteatus TaxID=296719 RepID=A0A6V7Q3M5_ANACO|nr:unnamed protein product [Ananas comosus var. bracteatus]
MSIVQLFFSKLLEEICQRLGFRVPDCVATVGAEGCFVAYIDLPIARNGAIVEIARCWGGASSDFLMAKDDSAHVAIQRMKAELDLHIKDINYDDCIMYKSMYDNVTAQLNDLLGQFNKLKREHSILRDCYASSVAEKLRYIDEHAKMHRTMPNAMQPSIASMRNILLWRQTLLNQSRLLSPVLSLGLHTMLQACTYFLLLLPSYVSFFGFP